MCFFGCAARGAGGGMHRLNQYSTVPFAFQVLFRFFSDFPPDFMGIFLYSSQPLVILHTFPPYLFVQYVEFWHKIKRVS